MTTSPDPTEVPAGLRAALAAASYTYDAVAELLGPEGHRALERNETTPGLRAAADDGPLATLTRLFLLQAPVDRAAADRALPAVVEPLVAAGVLHASGGEVVARLDLRPYALDGAEGPQDLWVLSDLTPGMDGDPVRVDGDYVLGISPASTSLAQLTIREPVRRSWDLGTGCGVQALHLASHSDSVLATDVNPRALRMARFNARLNGADAVEVRAGSFFEPVAGDRFDLIATNPPFVISPATGTPLVYRDSGLPGDRAVEEIVRTAPRHLTDGGWCQVLANWVIEEGRPWQERLGSWIPEDCSAFVVQREALDPAAYVELWLKDAGLHGGRDYRERYDTWLHWFQEQGIAQVGFGWINVQRGGADRELIEWPYEVEQPIAPAIAQWSRSRAGSVGDLADSRLVVRSDVRQETQGAPGAEDPETIVLRQQRGMRRARQVDTVEAALAGACDGELTVGQILDAVAVLTDREPADLREVYLPVVRALVAEGFLSAAP